MRKNLWHVLAADRVDHDELQHVIQRRFPSASQPGLREVVYPGESSYAVKLVFSKDDKLTRIEAGALLTPELEQRLRAAVTDALLTTAGYRVQREVFFADHKLTGSWRYRDWFQVVPVPAAAPQLNCLIGDHPFVLEVRVLASSDGSITNLRARKAMREVLLLLAGLVEGSMHPLVARPFYGSWVRIPAQGGNTSYVYPHYPSVVPTWADDFSAPGMLAPIVPSLHLFGLFGRTAGQPLNIPTELTNALDRYQGLDPEHRDQVLRSCYWVQRANTSFLESFCQSFLAVVTVAETLMATNDLRICKTCGQHQYGLRGSFAQFLDDYVPLDQLTSMHSGETRRFRERLKHLYDTRSAITHGGDLRGRDGAAHHFTPLGNRDDDDLRTLLRVMPFALGAWLRSQDTPRPVEYRRWPRTETFLRWLAVRIALLHRVVLRACERLGT